MKRFLTWITGVIIFIMGSVYINETKVYYKNEEWFYMIASIVGGIIWVYFGITLIFKSIKD